MPNKNYVKGRRKEYKIVNEYRALGFDIVQRTAGSHSPIDILAINKKARKIVLIQAKPDDYSIMATARIYMDNFELQGKFDVEFMVI
jgi:Holliday junction resolvase